MIAECVLIFSTAVESSIIQRGNKLEIAEDSNFDPDQSTAIAPSPEEPSKAKRTSTAGSGKKSSAKRVSFGSPIVAQQSPAHIPDTVMHLPTPFSSTKDEMTSTSESVASSPMEALNTSTHSAHNSSFTDRTVTYSMLSTPGSADFPRGRSVPDETFVEDGTLKSIPLHI